MRGHHEAVGGVGMVVALHFVGGGTGLHAGGTEFKEGGPQQILRQSKVEYSTHKENDTTNGIMGYGGALTLVNGSPFDWTLSGHSSYQMKKWEWPKVTAGTTS